MGYLRVEDKDGLVRDTETKAILNTNTDAYNEYVRNYMSKLKENKKIKDLENEIVSVKNDLEEIKMLLRGLSEKWIQMKLS